jgi:hypothetical protein
MSLRCGWYLAVLDSNLSILRNPGTSVWGQCRKNKVELTDLTGSLNAQIEKSKNFNKFRRKYWHALLKFHICEHLPKNLGIYRKFFDVDVNKIYIQNEVGREMGCGVGDPPNANKLNKKNWSTPWYCGPVTSVRDVELFRQLSLQCGEESRDREKNGKGK